MDAQDFDRLARSAASGLSRRRILGWIGGGSAATVLASPALTLAAGGPAADEITAADAQSTVCTIQMTGSVRLGPSAGSMLTTKAKNPGQLTGKLDLTIGSDGAVDSGTLTLDDGTKAPVVGQVVGRSVNLRATLGKTKLVVLVGTAAEDMSTCHGVVDGMMTGPATGDLGDWHGSAVAKKTNGTSGSTSTSGDTSTNDNTNQTTCPAGQADCGKGCTSLADPANCGACGNRCADNQTCVGGTCTDAAGCPQNQFDCGNGCIDLSQDVGNCGECGRTCDQGLTCVNGGCCLPDEICDGLCVDLLADPNNCGACGQACTANQTCSTGACTDVQACPDGQTDCGNGCVDTNSDPMNCGACGNACGDTELCFTGVCAPGCGDNETKCGDVCIAIGVDGNCTGGCEDCAGLTCCDLAAGCVDTTSDAFNCGACGVVCDDGQTCTDGVCQ